ncbi:MAG: class I SAM-dependent methyltransferase [Burkholderiales bacterium]|nr:class I SAM-dependent methyltransferase [Phycisphaerae bacterium]
MAMLQDDIRKHYESNWQKTDESAESRENLRYSSPVEDEVLYPAYRELIADLQLVTEDTRILDVGSGSGRWVDFFTKHFRPKSLMGVDFAAAAVRLLNRWYPSTPRTELKFDVCDITKPDLDLFARFDLINIANVLFHIPENDRYVQAVRNLCNHLAPGGRIVTTEYLPRVSMRTQWMMVRSRYEFEQIIAQAGLKIVETRAFCFFSNDPMGVEGPDAGVRGNFQRVRAMSQQLLNSASEPGTRAFLVQMMAEIERACVGFAREHIAEADLPSQKLVVLGAR